MAKNVTPTGVKQTPKKDFLYAEDRSFTLNSFEIPTLGQMTPAAIVDELGVIKEVKKRVDKLEKYLVEAAKARTTNGLIRGDHYQGMVTDSQQERISAELAREKLSAEQVASITNVIDVKTLKVAKIGD